MRGGEMNDLPFLQPTSPITFDPIPTPARGGHKTMLRSPFTAGPLALGILVTAVASPDAAELGTVTSARAYNFDSPARGFARIIGTFSSSAALDLGAATVEA